MQERYYSQKLKKFFPTRLDYLLYAHDGRGYGHVSRNVAVGLALKRCYPEASVLVITGGAHTSMIIGPGSLDWIKLPSYQTVLIDGVSEGRDGYSGYYKSILGNLRADMIKAMVEILKPHCILVDHNPFGKRKELLKALEQSVEIGSQWILGLRGVIGEDKHLWSRQCVDIVQKYYREILWYGDSGVLGMAPLERIRHHFKQEKVTEMGYVSRLLEIGKLIPAETSHAEKTICTISLPWLGELSRNVILSLHEAARDIGPGRGKLNVYVPETNAEEINKLFMDLPHCIVKPISDGYIRSLLNSQSAVIYGGYNSVLDVIAAGIPALVILRSTRDGEQQEHLLRLQASVGGNLQIIEEDKVSGQRVKKLLQDLMARTPSLSADINCCGAERTAKYLYNILMDNK